MIRQHVRKIVDSFFSFVTRISPTLNTKLWYFRAFRKRLNLNNPKTFNEKILWLKLKCYIKDPLVEKCVDKYRVREYVEECGCKDILNGIIHVYDSADEIDWNKLPNKFVLKWNFGAGMNLICSDKNKLNYKECEKQLNEWSKNKYWLLYSEMQYKNYKKKIVCEKFLESAEGESLADYKVYCFNGKAMYVMLCTERTNNEKSVHANYIFFDKNWKPIPYSKYTKEHINELNIAPPKELDSLLYYAEKLSEPFPFVRADFYIVEGKIYFGELTFTPAGGLDTDLLNGDVEMGKLIQLPHVKNKGEQK